MSDVLLQIDRPHISKLNLELKRFALDNWDDPSILAEILVELLFRKRRLAVNLRTHIVERFIELQMQGFQWPSTEIGAGYGELNNTDWPELSPLSFMGYRTGQRGVTEESRREILDFVYTQTIPNINSVEYMKKWGKPNTGMRLSQMARSLAKSVKYQKRRDLNACRISIMERETDLNYLKRKYYVGKYDFTWPRTDVK